MSLSAERSATNSTPRPTIPEGRHIARCYGVIDLGTQMVSFMGAEAKPKPIIMLQFEIPAFMHVFTEEKGKQPLVTSQEYTFLATDRSKICKVLKSWGRLKEMPTRLNLKPYLGQYCEVKMEHTISKKDGKIVYSNIADGGRYIDALTPEQKASLPLVLPTGSNPNMWFDLDNFSWEVFNKIPEWIQKKIKLSQEWSGILAKYPAPAAQTTSPDNGGVVVAEEEDGSPAF